MSQKQARKRGANYTPEEKALLLDLIMQFKDIVESKRTGGIIIQKKKEAWTAITSKYNSNCSSGPRDVDQLKALYDNMKQKSRKEVGEKNKAAYIQATEMSVVTEEDVAQALMNIKEDKKEMNKTGGGFWKPKATENDAKVLAIIQEQIEPLCNPFDSAAGFFNDMSDIPCNGQTNDNDFAYATTSYTSCVVPIQEASTEIDMNTCQERLPSQEILIETPKRVLIECQQEKGVKRKGLEMGSGSTKKNSRPAHSKIQQSKKVIQRKLIKSSTAEHLKKLYFKKKCQNADLEKKKIMLEILHLKKEHDLRMQLLKKKIINLSKD